MANQDQIDAMMRNFLPEAELLQMAPEDLWACTCSNT
jgi:hypothetical protein